MEIPSHHVTLRYAFVRNQNTDVANHAAMYFKHEYCRYHISNSMLKQRETSNC